MMDKWYLKFLNIHMFGLSGFLEVCQSCFELSYDAARLHFTMQEVLSTLAMRGFVLDLYCGDLCMSVV